VKLNFWYNLDKIKPYIDIFKNKYVGGVKLENTKC